MNVCRICLSINIYEEISRLRLSENGEKVNFADVITFCLNVKISKNSKFTSYICIKCYNQIVTFYNFKQLALKNDKHLLSLEQNGDKETVFLKDEDVKDENSCDNNFEVKQELDNIILDIKQEQYLEAADDHLDSEDEVLSVIKQDKENDLDLEGNKEIAFTKRKRGRPKKVKLDNKRDSKQVCDQCGKAVRNLREHSLLHKPEKERKIVQCKSCTKTFSSYSARYKHHKRKHLGLKYQCNVCDKVVTSLRNHMLIVHNPEQLPFACISCERRFISQSVLDVHMRSHTKDKPFECAICKKKFKTKILMESHKRQVHDQEKTHLCQYCSKSFFKKYHLQLHLRSHTKEKPCKCEECGKHFQSTTILKIHQRIHTGVKNYACTLCDMTFYRQGALTTHMISHTKVKKHRCQYCGVPFGRSDHRNRHERTAHLKHMIT